MLLGGKLGNSVAPVINPLCDDYIRIELLYILFLEMKILNYLPKVILAIR